VLHAIRHRIAYRYVSSPISVTDRELAPGVCRSGARLVPRLGVRVGVTVQPDPRSDPSVALSPQVGRAVTVDLLSSERPSCLGSPRGGSPHRREVIYLLDDPVLRVQSQLTSRDHVLLGWLYDHGVLTSFQIAHALFSSLDFCQRRLRALTGLGLVGRFRPHKPDGGSFPYHYVIDQLGAEVVAASRAERPPRRDHARTERRRWTSNRTLAHRLGVNQFFIDLAGYSRTHDGVHLRTWWPESVCQRPAVFTRPDDPGLVRAYQPRIRPDGYGVWVEHGLVVPMFVEYDTGTEPLWTLVDKLAGYGELTKKIGRVWPVLFWLHSAARERNLRQELANERLVVPVATGARDHATQAGLCPAEAVWATVHGDGRRVRLVDLSRFAVDTHNNTSEAA